jgi:hypothetical protein
MDRNEDYNTILDAWETQEAQAWEEYIAAMTPKVRAVFDECVSQGKAWEPGAMEELINEQE